MSNGFDRFNSGQFMGPAAGMATVMGGILFSIFERIRQRRAAKDEQEAASYILAQAQFELHEVTERLNKGIDVLRAERPDIQSEFYRGGQVYQMLYGEIWDIVDDLFKEAPALLDQLHPVEAAQQMCQRLNGAIQRMFNNLNILRQTRLDLREELAEGGKIHTALISEGVEQILMARDTICGRVLRIYGIDPCELG